MSQSVRLLKDRTKLILKVGFSYIQLFRLHVRSPNDCMVWINCVVVLLIVIVLVFLKICACIYLYNNNRPNPNFADCSLRVIFPKQSMRSKYGT